MSLHVVFYIANLEVFVSKKKKKKKKIKNLPCFKQLKCNLDL